MVVGPIMDALIARREGSRSMHVLTRGNRQVAATLSVRAKVTFWLTNLPYFALSAWVAFHDHPSRTAVARVWQWHCAATWLVAVISSAFHGAVLFESRAAPRLMALDISVANGYGLSLMWVCGLHNVARLFAGPLALLCVSAYAKRTGRPYTYAVAHGAWHILSAYAMWRCLSHESPHLQQLPSSRQPLQPG